MPIFLIGVGLLFGFLWYFGTESARTKRIIGTVLAIGITCLSIYYYQALGIKKGIELRGGVAVSLRLQTADDGTPITETAVQEAIKVLERRLNAGGTEELIIAPQGDDRIFLQIPGVGDEAVKHIIDEVTKSAKLEFSLVHEQSFALADRVASGGEIVPGWRALPNAEAGMENEVDHYLVKKKSDMSGYSPTKAVAQLTPSGWVILVDFDSEGTERFAELSTRFTAPCRSAAAASLAKVPMHWPVHWRTRCRTRWKCFHSTRSRPRWVRKRSNRASPPVSPVLR